MLNWKRILIFVAIFFAATGLAAFPFGFIRGYCLASTGHAPAWLGPAQAMAGLLAAITVFAILAWVQKDGAFAHCFVVGLFSWFLSFPINVLLFHQPAMQWAAGAIVLVITAGIGGGAGVGLRHLISSGDKSYEVPQQNDGQISSESSLSDESSS